MTADGSLVKYTNELSSRCIYISRRSACSLATWSKLKKNNSVKNKTNTIDVQNWSVMLHAVSVYYLYDSLTQATENHSIICTMSQLFTAKTFFSSVYHFGQPIHQYVEVVTSDTEAVLLYDSSWTHSNSLYHQPHNIDVVTRSWLMPIKST